MATPTPKPSLPPLVASLLYKDEQQLAFQEHISVWNISRPLSTTRKDYYELRLTLISQILPDPGRTSRNYLSYRPEPAITDDLRISVTWKGGSRSLGRISPFMREGQYLFAPFSFQPVKFEIPVTAEDLSVSFEYLKYNSAFTSPLTSLILSGNPQPGQVTGFLLSKMRENMDPWVISRNYFEWIKPQYKPGYNVKISFNGYEKKNNDNVLSLAVENGSAREVRVARQGFLSRYLLNDDGWTAPHTEQLSFILPGDTIRSAERINVTLNIPGSFTTALPNARYLIGSLNVLELYEKEELAVFDLGTK